MPENNLKSKSSWPNCVLCIPIYKTQMKVVRTFHITPNHLTFYAILSFVLSNTKLYFYWRKQLTTNILTIYYELQLSLFSILGAYFNPRVLNTIIVIDSLLTAYDATLTLIIIILYIFSHINFPWIYTTILIFLM